MEGYLSEVRMFGGTFAPRGWMFCQGQLLAISQYDALFALLGTTYGGDGQSTFALPDLQSRVPVGTGQGLGLSSYTLGQEGGMESVTLITASMPTHNHASTSNIAATFQAKVNDSATGNVSTAEGTYLSLAASNMYGTAADEAMAADSASATIGGSITLSASGGSQPHDNIPPVLCLNYIICVEGIFPARN